MKNARKHGYIYCEGYTEEAFVNEVLAPYLAKWSVSVRPIICTTSRTASRTYRGGASSYAKIKNELGILCQAHENRFITTMFDYYAMPANTPRIECDERNIYRRMLIIEQAIDDDIARSNFFFHFMLHEFEGLLFSDPSAFSLIANTAQVEEIRKVRGAAQSPEHINNGYETAPSKRIKRIVPNYGKVTSGVLLSKHMGIECMLRECRHFSDWVDRMKA